MIYGLEFFFEKKHEDIIFSNINGITFDGRICF